MIKKGYIKQGNMDGKAFSFTQFLGEFPKGTREHRYSYKYKHVVQEITLTFNSRLLQWHYINDCLNMNNNKNI